MSDPKKSLGQHWLNDTESLKGIVAAANISSDQTVLEIGPGPGSLTQLLVTQAKDVVAIEIDSELAQNLPKRVNANNLLVVEEDIRQYDLTVLPKDYAVVANIPYYLTNYLLQLLFSSKNPPKYITLLIQKEVAERLAAQPGKMSVLAISAQLFGVIELGRVVEARLFVPPPKVDSQVIHIYRHESPVIDSEKPLFFRVVKAGFAAKRKKLLNNLSSGLGLEKEFVSAQLSNIGLSSNSRAQELSIKQWDLLTKAIKVAIR